MYYFIILLYTIWLLFSLTYIFKSKWLGKLKMPLHRYGFFANWSMYVPNSNRASKTYSLMYRDKSQEGEVKEWIEFNYPPWKPYLFLFNIKSRLYSIFNKCASILIRLNQQGETDLNKDPRFLYLCEIICDRPSAKSIGRQIQLQYQTVGGEITIVAKSEFIPLL